MLRRLRNTPVHRYLIVVVGVIALALLAAQRNDVRSQTAGRVAAVFEQRTDGLFVVEVVTGGPADLAGLAAGDRLLQIDGRPIVGENDYDAAALLFERGEPSAFTVERNGAMQVLKVRPGTPVDWALFLWTTAVVVLSLAGGAVCLAGRTADVRAALLAVVFFLIAIEFALPKGLAPMSWWGAVATASFYTLNGAQAAIELHLASVIPAPRRYTARRRAFIIGCYTLGGAVALIGTLAYAIESLGWQGLPFSLAQVDNAILKLFFPMWAVGGVALLATATARAKTTRDRFQAGLVLSGVLPWSVYSLVDWARGYPDDISSGFAQLLPFLVLFYPAAVFVAIFRYRLFDFPLVVRRSLLYSGLSSSLVLMFYAALGAGAAVLSKIVHGEGTSIWFMALATLVLGTMISPLSRATRGLIERRIFPDRQVLRTRLIDLASELPALGKLDRMGQHLVRSLRQIFGTTSATLLLVQPSSGALYRLAQSPRLPSHSGDTFFLAPEDPAIERLREEGGPLPGWDILGTSPILQHRLGRKQVELAVPLFRESRLVGILMMGQRVARGTFSAEEIELLSLVAHQVATVLENVRLFQSATYEGLTGLLRREAALEILDREVDRALRYDRPLTVALADIDHFKKINDRFGHLEGDRALRIVADALQSVIRASDAVARYGGEEFLLIFPETDIDDAGVLSEKLRSTIEQLELAAEDGTPIRIRVSIGVAALSGIPNDARNSEGFIAAADRELYRAKAAGRNRVEPGPIARYPAAIEAN